MIITDGREKLPRPNRSLSDGLVIKLHAIALVRRALLYHILIIICTSEPIVAEEEMLS